MRSGGEIWCISFKSEDKVANIHYGPAFGTLFFVLFFWHVRERFLAPTLLHTTRLRNTHPCLLLPSTAPQLRAPQLDTGLAPPQRDQSS